MLCILSLVAYGQLDDDRGYKVKVGDMAPTFKMKMQNGEAFDLSKQKNKVVMLQFTASWCGVCRKEMPFIESDIWLKHKANPNFVLVAIDRDEPFETVSKFVASTQISYPIGLDPKSKIFTLYAFPEAGSTRNVIIVSYTHLDVYKRQCCSCPKARFYGFYILSEISTLC